MIWTLNGEKTLPFCLQSIENALAGHIGKKIAVDAYSTDKTREWLRLFGWSIYDAECVGIPFQANQALKMVETKFFASFEQDIILCKNWFKQIINNLEDNVAVVQGVRVCVNRTLKVLELCNLGIHPRYVSLDNTVYNTELIRSIGGFNTFFVPKYGADKDLQDRVRASGYRWIVDKNVVSCHLKFTVKQVVAELREYLRVCRNSQDFVEFHVLFRILLTSPLKGLFVALKHRCPMVFFVYPYLRLHRLLGCFG